MILPFYGEKALNVAQEIEPQLVLTFYKHAIMLRKGVGAGLTEYPIDPSALATLLAEKISMSTGLLAENTLFVGQFGVVRKVIEYRPAEVTGIWLEGSDAPLRIPLPPLVMERSTTADRSPSYRVFAVMKRPETLDEKLYGAPLPNVGGGGVCWGTVARPSAEELKGTSLATDWKAFLGSRFGNHSVEGRSKKYPKDLRKLYMALEGVEAYPLDDLVESKPMTIADLVEES